MQSSTSINEAAGFTGSVPFGDRPALLVVDFHRGATDPEISPLGVDAQSQIAKTNEIIAVCRERKIPIVFFAIGYEPNLKDGGLWVKKVPSLQPALVGTPFVEIDPRLNYDAQSDTYIVKKHASAFFGTGLASLLSAQRVDTVIITGSTTSGCIRATAVDAIAHGFAPIVVEDAVTDRAPLQHESNLIDLQSKYAEVVSTESVISTLNSSNSKVATSS